MAGLTLDSGALFAAERADGAMWRWLALTRRRGEMLTVPTAALSEVWRGPRQARLGRLLSVCELEPLDDGLARRAGELLGRTGTSDPVDAIVAVSAAQRGDLVLTTDPGDLLVLAEDLRSIRIHSL